VIATGYYNQTSISDMQNSHYSAKAVITIMPLQLRKRCKVILYGIVVTIVGLLAIAKDDIKTAP
jgi:TRAP-type C4-dicarboxylate transport system permease small subunit